MSVYERKAMIDKERLNRIAKSLQTIVNEDREIPVRYEAVTTVHSER